MIFSNSCTWLALSRPGLSKVTACPVAGSNPPCTHNLPPPSIIGFKSSPIGSQYPFFSRICFHRNGSHFVHTNHPSSRQRGRVGCDDAPLFSTNSGSCFSASWNQLSWRFHRNPSPSTHSQIVESDKCTPCRSLKAVCRRSKVHNLKGYPSVSGFCCARLIKALRTLWSWVGGPSGFGSIFQSGNPFLIEPSNPSLSLSGSRQNQLASSHGSHVVLGHLTWQR